MPEFYYRVDETIPDRINKLRNNYQEDAFVRYEQSDDEPDFKGYLTIAEYQKNIDDFMKAYQRLTSDEYKEKAVNGAQKKADGTFYKGRVYERVGIDNCTFIQEWHNTWMYEALTVRAVTDSELELVMGTITDTPG